MISITIQKQFAEKIWSIGKGGVARKNVSGNINDVLKWTEEELAKIDAATWMRCIDHQMDELLHLMEHDGIVAPKDVIIENEYVALQQFSDNIKVHSILKHIYSVINSDDRKIANYRTNCYC